MNNIKILYSIWNNPRIDSLPLQRTSERHVFTRTHMNTFTFQKLPQMPVGLFSWTEYPPHLIISIYYTFPQKSSVNLSPRQNLLCINNYQLKQPLEGMLCTSPGGSGWLEPAAKACPGLLGHLNHKRAMGLSGGSASRAICVKFKFS